MTFAFEEYEAHLSSRDSRARVSQTISALPLPNNMKDQNTITYNTQKGHIAVEGFGPDEW
jgi:hypothetical protein